MRGYLHLHLPLTAFTLRQYCCTKITMASYKIAIGL